MHSTAYGLNVSDIAQRDTAQPCTNTGDGLPVSQPRKPTGKGATLNNLKHEVIVGLGWQRVNHS